MSQSRVARLEKDKQPLSGASAGEIAGIAAALGVPISEMLRAADVDTLVGLRPDTVEAAYQLDRLPEPVRARILALIAEAEAEAGERTEGTESRESTGTEREAAARAGSDERPTHLPEPSATAGDVGAERSGGGGDSIV